MARGGYIWADEDSYVSHVKQMSQGNKILQFDLEDCALF